jgi:hypothetical protein
VKNKKKALIVGALASTILFAASDCEADDSDVVDHNITKAAKNFEVMRRVVVTNGITDQTMLVMEGRCNIDPTDSRIWITCKVAEGDDVDSYKRSQVYLSDNVFVTVEQMESIGASAYHYRRTFKPQTVIPDIDFRGSTDDLPSAQ